MSPNWRPAASPSRRPAKAHTATNACKSSGAASRAAPTCSGVGILIYPSGFASRGGVIPAVGSCRITRALTAARKAMRT